MITFIITSIYFWMKKKIDRWNLIPLLLLHSDGSRNEPDWGTLTWHLCQKNAIPWTALPKIIFAHSNNWLYYVNAWLQSRKVWLTNSISVHLVVIYDEYGYDIGRKPKNGRSRAVHRTNLGKIRFKTKCRISWSYKNVVLY